jgi:hypothetical protein
MTDEEKQGAARVRTAKAVLDYAVKATEQEQIAERTEDLEGRTENGHTRQAA